MLFAFLPLTDVLAFHHARDLLIGRGLAVLAAWVIGNILVSGYELASPGRRTEAYYFHLLNVGWAVVNGAITTWGILNLYRTPPAGLTLAAEAATQHYYEQLFLVNAFLDVGYVLVGTWLRHRAQGPQATHPARLAGFGRSLWVQGGFLLVVDAGLYWWLHVLGAALPVAWAW